MSWASEIADAQAGIKEGGRSFTGTLTKPGATTGDAHNPSRSAGASVTAYLVETRFRQSEIDGERVQRDDRLFIMSTEGITAAPAPGDILTIASVAHMVIDVMPVAPGGSVIYWKVQVRA